MRSQGVTNTDSPLHKLRILARFGRVSRIYELGAADRSFCSVAPVLQLLRCTVLQLYNFSPFRDFHYCAVMDGLPTELVLMIASHLPNEHLINLYATSRRFYQIFRTKLDLYHTIRIRGTLPHYIKFWLFILQNRRKCKAIRHIHLDPLDTRDNFTDEFKSYCKIIKNYYHI